METPQEAAHAFSPAGGQTVKGRIHSVRKTNRATLIQVEGSSVEVALPPHLYLHPFDEVEVVRDRTGHISRLSKTIHDEYDKTTHTLPVFPLYSVQERLHIPPHVLNVTFCERSEPSEWRSARLLEKFHYRGMGLNRIVGRRSVLLAKMDGFGVVGYGVVSASVAAARPRFKLLQITLQQLMKTKLINK